jgi:DNA-binding Lrp family transcriptional regulator
VRETDTHPLTSYIFVTTAVGNTRTALRGIADLDLAGCRILTVEQVIGGYDIIAKIETPDIDSLARAITDGIREVPGVLDVVASRCCDGREVPQPEPSARLGALDVVSITHNSSQA